jgi:hypothetical protein
LGWPPPRHGLGTGGGRTPAGQWAAGRNGLLVPARGGMAVWRGQRRGALRRAWGRDALVLPEARRPPQVLTLFHRLGHARKPPWHGPMRERSRHGAGVGTSLARSLRGGPITHTQRVAWDGERVPCTSRARAAAQASGAAPRPCMTVSSTDLLQRWLLPVPAPQRRGVRASGLSHHPHAEALARCRAQGGHPPVVVPVALDGQPACAQRGEAPPERCPACGQRLVGTGGIPRGGAPPPGLAGERAA